MKKQMSNSLQRGQSLVEFLVAMVFMIPLFLGVYYVGKYADLQQSAVQASRYAAFQRAMQPDESRLPTAEIEDKLRARFFARGDAFGYDGRLASSDSANHLTNPQGQVVFWRDLAGNPLLRSLGQVTLGFESEAITPVAAAANQQGEMLYGQKNQPIQTANVEVSLVDHLTGRQQPLKIGAATAAMAGAWNAEGSSGVRAGLSSNPLRQASDPMIHLVGTAVSAVVWLFETNQPVTPCVRVEAVPLDRTSGGSDALPGSCQ